jgi:hypothetical protein
MIALIRFLPFVYLLDLQSAGSTFRPDASALHFDGVWPDVNLWHTVNALRGKCPVIDAGGVSCVFQCVVGDNIPCFAPFLQGFLAIPVAVFLAESIAANGAHRQQNMNMWIFTFCVMDVHVGNHAFFDKLCLGKLTHQITLLVWRQFCGKCNFNLPCKLCILSFLGRFYRIPKYRPVMCPFRGVSRCQNFRVINAALVRVVVYLACPLVD